MGAWKGLEVGLAAWAAIVTYRIAWVEHAEGVVTVSGKRKAVVARNQGDHHGKKASRPILVGYSKKSNLEIFLEVFS